MAWWSRYILRLRFATLRTTRPPFTLNLFYDFPLPSHLLRFTNMGNRRHRVQALAHAALSKFRLHCGLIDRIGLYFERTTLCRRYVLPFVARRNSGQP